MPAEYKERTMSVSIEEMQQDMIELQAKVAYQEDMLQSLNDVIAEQDKAIHLLNSKLARWQTRLDEMAYAMDADASKGVEPPPPHY